MKTLIVATVSALLLSGCVIARVSETGARPATVAAVDTSRSVVRTYSAPDAPYARTLVIPPGFETIRLPGVVPDALNPGSAAAARYGDTESQTASVLAKIAGMLAEVGASEADVVAATVYLVAPNAGSGMDFDGMMRAWRKHYGTETQPNRPVRSTVEVAGLVRPGMLVEIEVTAARPAR